MELIDGVEVFGPPGCGLPVVASNGDKPVAVMMLPPAEFAPTPPVIPSPIAPLQPHPSYPATYPPPASGGPTETGPRKVPVDFDSSYYIFKSPSTSSAVTPSGDMLKNEYATNAIWGMVDWAQRANWTAEVPWDGIVGKPSHLGTYWWVGQDAPPDPLPGAVPGDLYLDSVRGDVYQLS